MGTSIKDDEVTDSESVGDLVGEASRENPYLILMKGSSNNRMYKLGKDPVVIGRSVAAGIVLDDDGISREHCRVCCDPEGGVTVEDLGSTNGTWVNGSKVKQAHLSDGEKFQLGASTLFKFSYQDLLDEAFQQALYEAATKDGLTQIFNRRVLIDQLRIEFIYHRRHHRPLSLCLMDIDRFKGVNDTYGHPAGDAVLSSMALKIASAIRAEDVFARYGGEEFGVVLRESDEAGALLFAERVRSSIEAARFSFMDQHGKVQELALTLSLGISTLKEENFKTPEDLISGADRALYQAKSAGRNRSVALGPKASVEDPAAAPAAPPHDPLRVG